MTRGEVDVVIHSRRWFVGGRTRQRVGSDDPLFVPAAHSHRFEDFSDDFCAWVTFYGREGGEQS